MTYDLQPITYNLSPMTDNLSPKRDHLQPITCKYILLIFAVLICPTYVVNAAVITFSPRLTISGEYNDNIYLTPEDEESDFITAVSPGFTIGFEEKSTGFSMTYAPAYSSYAENHDNDTWRHSVRGDAWSKLTGNTRFDVFGSYLRTEDPQAEDIEPENDLGFEPLSDRNIRRITYTRTAGFRVTHDYGGYNSTLVGYEFQSTRYDDTFGDNYEAHTPFIRIIYWPLPNRWGTELGFSFIRGEYEKETDDLHEYRGYFKLIREFSRRFDAYLQYSHSKMTYDGETEPYQVYNPSAGINYDVFQDTTVGLSLGYFYQDMEESEGGGGISATADLTNKWGGAKGTTIISASSGYDVSALDTEELGFSRYYEASAAVEYFFFRNFSGNISGSVRWDKYERPDTTVFDLEDREDTYTKIAAGFKWRITAWLSQRTELSSRMLNSNYDGNDYTENRAFIEFTLAPSQPIRKVY